MGFEDIQLKMPLTPGKANSRIVAHHVRTDHCERLCLGRIHLPGIIELPGSFAGNLSSPKPYSEDRTQKTNIICNLK